MKIHYTDWGFGYSKIRKSLRQASQTGGEGLNRLQGLFDNPISLKSPSPKMSKAIRNFIFKKIPSPHMPGIGTQLTLIKDLKKDSLFSVKYIILNKNERHIFYK